MSFIISPSLSFIFIPIIGKIYSVLVVYERPTRHQLAVVVYVRRARHQPTVVVYDRRTRHQPTVVVYDSPIPACCGGV